MNNNKESSPSYGNNANSSRSSILKTRQNNPQSKSCTNINEILHFLSQKNATPQTNILWAQELRKDVDRIEFQKRLDRIPHKAPAVFDEQYSERRAYKKRYCPTDPSFYGNLTEVKHFTQNGKGYYQQKDDVNFSASLRNYKIDDRKAKTYRSKGGNAKDLGIATGEDPERQLEVTEHLKKKEKGWNNLPKIDKKEYFNFEVPKCHNIKESINENNKDKYAQYKGYTPQYSILPKYNEDFGDKNSVSFSHLKQQKNSQLKWMFHLRSYSKK